MLRNLRKSRHGDEKEQCDVTDCNNESKRAVAYKKVEKALTNLKFDKVKKRVHLCKEHYKQYKKATKTERTLETLTWE